MATTTRPVTADDLQALGEDAHVELIRGAIHEMSPSKPLHGFVSGNFAMELGLYGRQAGGRILTGEAGYLLERDPDTLLVPDVAYVKTDRLPPRDQWNRYCEVAPDVVVEVLSPSNSPAEMDRKVATYLAAGVPLVWVADPVPQRITAHRPGMAPQILEIDDVLDGGDVLPGFRVPVRTFFG